MGCKVSPATISELNKKAYVHIEAWRNRPLQGGRYPYVYVDGIYLRRNWGGEFENVAIMVAIAVNEDGYREVLGTAESMKEDKASWVSFFQWLRGRGLDGVKLIVGDKCLGMLEAVGEVFPEAKYQRCTAHFYRNVFSVVPRSKVKLVAKMFKAIHAQESKKAAREKAAITGFLFRLLCISPLPEVTFRRISPQIHPKPSPQRRHPKKGAFLMLWRAWMGAGAVHEQKSREARRGLPAPKRICPGSPFPGRSSGVRGFLFRRDALDLPSGHQISVPSGSVNRIST